MDFVMDACATDGRRRIHSTGALDILRYKNSRSGYLSRVTTLFRATEALLEDTRNVEEVSQKLLEINEAFGRFEKAHYEYIATLSGDLEQWESEGRYFREHSQRKELFVENIIRWINDVKSRTETRESTEIRPEDSVSSAGSRRSRSSTTVSIKQLKAKEALARLKVEQLLEKQELSRREEEMKMERQMLEAKYELEQATLQVKILEEDHSVIGGAVPKTSKQSDLSIGGFISKRDVGSKIKDVKTDIGSKDEVKDAARSRLNPLATEFTSATVQDSELSRTNSVDSDLAIVEDVLDKLGTTIRQGFALPKPDLSTFDGNPMVYWSFIRSFENSIERNATSESEKLMYLLQYTSGDARKTIECCVVMDPTKGYEAARKLLKERFGHPYTIAAKFVEEITEGPQIRASDRSGLLAFADQLKNCEHTLESMGYLDEINSADNLRRIVQRLPFHLRTKFVEIADGIQQAGKRPNIKDISAFVANKARAANNPVFGSVMDFTPDSKRGSSKQKSSPRTSDPLPHRITTLNTQGTISNKQGNLPSRGSGNVNSNMKFRVCPACNGNHILTKCQIFGKKTFDERLQIMRQAQLCHNYFHYGHIARGCLAKSACQVDGCSRRHHTLLHPPCQQQPNSNTTSESNVTQATKIPQASQDSRATQVSDPSPTQGGQLNSTLVGSGKVCLRIVPVKVQSQNSTRKVLTYALLDNGSDVSLCAKDLAAQLGV